MTSRHERRKESIHRRPLVAGALLGLVAGLAGAAPALATASPGAQPATSAGPAPARAHAQALTASQVAIRACAAAADYLDIAGQGPLCRGNGLWVMRTGNGREVTVSAPDRISALATTRTHAAPASAAPLLASQCVDPAQHTHIELYYAHFSDQPDNYSSHVADIQQMFRDVDSDYIDYDATNYFGVGMHLYVECDGNGNPVVHDIALSTPLGSSNFDSIITDMTNQHHSSNLAHYWIWTDGNPEAGLGYAGQSTIEDDNSASASNSINSNFEFSVNYGFASNDSGAQIFAHENGHAMGAVQLSAPDSTGLWHCTDGYDVMCYNDGGPKGGRYSNSACSPAPNGTLIFDCKFNDYFNPAPAAGSYLATHWNVAGAYNHWLFIQALATTTSLSAGSSAVYSQPVALTATVHPPGGTHPSTPTGSITFYDGATNLGSATLNSSGVASFTTTSLSLGGHSLSATYNGSGVYLSSSSGTSSLTVSQAQSATSVSTSANPAPLGAGLTITATVAPVSPATAHPGGSVTFYDGGSSLGTAALNGSGQASINQTLSYGGHQLSASYAGSSDFAASDDSSSPLQEMVLYASSTRVTTSAPGGDGEYGTAVTFSATVTAGGGASGNPTGSVTFEDGATPLAAPVPLSGSHASLTTSALAPGTRQVNAVYSGDSAFVPSTGTVTETVTTFSAFLELDDFGGRHPVDSPQLSSASAAWPSNTARGVVLRADGRSGYVLDDWGGLHPFGGAPTVRVSGYWVGQDYARGLVLRADGVSGYVLDAWGGLHPFGGAPAVHATGYWPGEDVVKGVVLRADGQSGYVLDDFGGVHPFGVNGDIPPVPHVTGYWRGWNIARGITLDEDGQGGYVLDGWGGLHPFGNAPPVTETGYWRGWDIARSLVVLPGPLHMGYVLDGWGGLHSFGGAPQVSVPPGGYFAGHDAEHAITLR